MKKVPVTTPQEIIKALRDGHIVREGNGVCEYLLVDGIICRRIHAQRQYTINASIPYEPTLYYEDRQLKIEVGQVYKTLKGNRVFIAKKGALYYEGAVEGYTNCFIYYNEHGKVVDSRGKCHPDSVCPEDIQEVRENEQVNY